MKENKCMSAANVSSTKQQNDSSQQSFKNLLDTYSAKLPKVGDVITGKVVSITKNEVQIDIDGIATGIVRGFELVDESGDYSNLKIGDEVSATVLDLENEAGLLELSFRSAGHKKAWDYLKELFEKGTPTEVKVLEANKGGLLVLCGNVKGFMPVSQLSPDHYPRIQGGDKGKILEKLRNYVGTMFEAKVIDVNEEEEKLIVSEKSAWEEKQKDVISSYKVGDSIEGVVTVITDFGAFVKFGDGLEGLIHISELAWQRIDDPKDYIKSGQKVSAVIIKVEGSKIFLSMKRLVDDPWKNVSDRYKLNQRVQGKVLKVNPFGLFVELDPEIHGLAHVSELSSKQGADPYKFANPGDVLEFEVVSIEPSEHRLGLSLKALSKKEHEEPPQEEVAPQEISVQEETPAEEKEQK